MEWPPSSTGSETGSKLCRSPQVVHLNHCFCNGWEFIKQNIALYLGQSVKSIVIDSCWAIEHAIEELCPPFQDSNFNFEQFSSVCTGQCFFSESPFGLKPF